jgi:hypothetical protein
MVTHKDIQIDKRGRRVGGIGGGLKIEPGVGLMYSVGFYSGHAYLEAAVLMHHDHVCDHSEPTRPLRPPPPGTRGGGGSQLGPYFVICYYRFGRLELYVDGDYLLSLESLNVVLLEEADRVPKIISMHQVDDDFGDIDLGQEVILQSQIGLVDIVKERLYGHRAVGEFLSR